VWNEGMRNLEWRDWDRRAGRKTDHTNESWM
jgi:hypothetical protein